MDDQNKNLILAVVLSGIVLLGWQVFFPAQDPTASVTSTNVLETSDGSIALAPPSTSGGDIVIDVANAATSAAEQAPRVTIDTDRVQGSISLAGGRIDDLSLKDYTVDIDSDEIVTLLTPIGTDEPYYAVYGWAPGGNLGQDDVPGANTIWSVEAGDTLTVDTPVTLAWSNTKGLTFRRTIAIDENYLFSITQSVQNDGTDAARLAAYGIVARHGTPDVSKYFVLHEGLVRQTDKDLEEANYKDIAKYDFDPREGCH